MSSDYNSRYIFQSIDFVSCQSRAQKCLREGRTFITCFGLLLPPLNVGIAMSSINPCSKHLSLRHRHLQKLYCRFHLTYYRISLRVDLTLLSTFFFFCSTSLSFFPMLKAKISELCIKCAHTEFKCSWNRKVPWQLRLLTVFVCIEVNILNLQTILNRNSKCQ